MPNVLMCMTPGVSLDVWRKSGTLHRETALMRYLSDDNWQIKVLTFRLEKAKDYQLPETISTIYYPHRRLLGLLKYSYSDLRFWVDLIQTNQSYLSWHYTQAATKWKKPILLRCGWVYGEGLETTQGMTNETIYVQNLERKAFRQATLVEVTSSHLRDWLIERYDVESSRIYVIPNHVDTNLFSPVSGEKIKRSVIGIGNLNPVKRFDLFVRACAKANVSVVTILGEGKERKMLMQLAQDLGVDLRLPGIAKNEELPPLLQQHDIFLTTSLREGHPKALIEAMSCGMPCVGVDVVGIRSCILESQGGGILVESDIDAIAEALNSLFDNEEKKKEIGSRAREYICENMDISAVLLKRKNLMLKCLEEYSRLNS